MREHFDTNWGKFDSPMTQFVYERVILNGFSDEFVSNEFSGDWAERVGRRVVFGDDRGFITMDSYATEAEAIEAFASAEDHIDPSIDDSWLSDMVDGYVDCALWSSVHYADEADDGTPMDDLFGPDDIDVEGMASMGTDCENFARENWSDLKSMAVSQAGHDFWLTRNHHGAGFWDRGLGEAGDRLTKSAHAYGSSDLYVGDDGKVYVS